MSTMTRLSTFVNERLSAAVVEIFGEIEKTIGLYETEVSLSRDEIGRLREELRLLRENAALDPPRTNQSVADEKWTSPLKQNQWPPSPTENKEESGPIIGPGVQEIPQTDAVITDIDWDYCTAQMGLKSEIKTEEQEFGIASGEMEADVPPATVSLGQDQPDRGLVLGSHLDLLPSSGDAAEWDNTDNDEDWEVNKTTDEVSERWKSTTGEVSSDLDELADCGSDVGEYDDAQAVEDNSLISFFSSEQLTSSLAIDRIESSLSSSENKSRPTASKNSGTLASCGNRSTTNKQNRDTSPKNRSRLTSSETRSRLTSSETRIRPTSSATRIRPTSSATRIRPTSLATRIRPTSSETRIRPTSSEIRSRLTSSDIRNRLTTPEIRIGPTVSGNGRPLLMEHSNALSITQVTPIPTETNMGRYNKKQYCLYCKKPYSKLARHLQSAHSREPDVVKAFSCEKKSQERRRLLYLLKNRGNFAHNAAIAADGRGELIACRRPSRSTPFQAYAHCDYCEGLYVKKTLWRHRRYCAHRHEDGE